MDSIFLLKRKKELKIKYFLSFKEDLKLKSILISQNKKRERFFDGENNLYFNYSKDCFQGAKKKSKVLFFDSLNYKVINNYQKLKGTKNSYLLRKYNLIIKKIEERKDAIIDGRVSFLENISLVRLWNASMLTSILIGMVSMSFIYRYLGQNVSAKDDNIQQKVAGEMVIAEDNSKKKYEYDKKTMDILTKDKATNFEKRARKLVKGYPIEKMLPYIFKQDNATASFLIAIAKKESNWGKRVPVLNGQDCYNYWGYRQKRKRMGSGGHTCFDNRKDAIDTVGKRMHKLIFDYEKNTPAKMIVWKCGNSCSAHSKKSVQKWISDVNLYLKKLK